jgi:glycosyltransferase involved in cell wall biosynthesis
MYIHIVTPYFYPVTGGVEKHVYNVAVQLVARNHKITVHTAARTFDGKVLEAADEVDGIEIRRYKPVFYKGYFKTLFLPEIDDCNLIELQGYPSLTNAYVVHKYSTKYPIVWWPQGICAPIYTKFDAFLRDFYDRMIGTHLLNKCAKIVFMTEDELAYCRQKMNLAVSKSAVIPNGLFDSSFAQYDARSIKKKLGVEKYILYIGRLYYEKSPLDLLKAFVKIQKYFEELQIVFAGPDHGELKRIYGFAKNCGIENKIKYAGIVSEREKYELLAGCEFLVLPSRYEAQGIVLIEAWAQSKTFIATKVGGIPYLVKDNETGFLYEYGDINALCNKMKLLLSSESIRKKLGENGRKIAYEKYRWQPIMDNIERIYETLVKAVA